MPVNRRDDEPRTFKEEGKAPSSAQELADEYYLFFDGGKRQIESEEDQRKHIELVKKIVPALLSSDGIELGEPNTTVNPEGEYDIFKDGGRQSLSSFTEIDGDTVKVTIELRDVMEPLGREMFRFEKIYRILVSEEACSKRKSEHYSKFSKFAEGNLNKVMAVKDLDIGVEVSLRVLVDREKMPRRDEFIRIEQIDSGGFRITFYNTRKVPVDAYILSDPKNS